MFSFFFSIGLVSLLMAGVSYAVTLAESFKHHTVTHIVRDEHGDTKEKYSYVRTYPEHGRHVAVSNLKVAFVCFFIALLIRAIF